MNTTLHIDGANCSICFSEVLDDLGRIPGVRSVRGSIGGSCIEVDHDELPLDLLAATVRDHLHGIELFGSEVRMVPLDPVVVPACTLHAHAPTVAAVADRIDPTMTLADIVTRRPSLAAELERRGLDYCCHGARTLGAAAGELGLDAVGVADELNALAVDEAPAAWVGLGPAELVDHIEAVHHRRLWVELPRITALVDKIVMVHGQRHVELSEVQRVVGELRADFEPHLLREEQVLFPMVRQLAAAPASSDAARGLAEQIAVLAEEHETVGALLEDLRRITGGFEVPADGCATYTACYRALAELEADTHLHVHKENNVLFPAVRAAVRA